MKGMREYVDFLLEKACDTDRDYFYKRIFEMCREARP